MTNAQMKADRFGFWAYNRRKLSFIREQVASGRKIYLTSYGGRSTVVTGKTVSLISATPSGLYVEIRGKKVDYSQCEITAR